MSSVHKLGNQIGIFIPIVRFLVKKKHETWTSPVYMLGTIRREARGEIICAQANFFDPMTFELPVISSLPVNLFSLCYTSPAPHSL